MDVVMKHPITTPNLPMEVFHVNRERLLSRLRHHPDVCPGSMVYLEGGRYQYRYNTEAEIAPFRQESYFFWTFGVVEPGFSGIIDVDSGETSLLIEDFTDTKQKGAFCREEFRTRYNVNRVTGKEAMFDLRHQPPSTILTLTSGSSLKTRKFERNVKVDCDILLGVMAECRVFKSNHEIDILRYAHKVSSDAHKMLMRSVKHGMYEYQAESVYLHYCLYNANMRHVGWPNCTASGHTGAIAQHGRAWSPNCKQIKDGDMCLFDLGTEYHCYATDVTTSFPANGVFTRDQSLIYETVLSANRAVMEACKPGVYWVDMHLLSQRVLLEGLRDAGLVSGDVTDMMAVHLGAVFMPHGVGHLVGLDVVDVGGYKQGEDPTYVGPVRLRTNRILEPDMVVTIEPSCLFRDQLLDAALKNPQQLHFLCAQRIQDFRGTGGVRVEDTVVLTEDGVDNLVQVPRSVADIEAWMAARGDV